LRLNQLLPRTVEGHSLSKSLIAKSQKKWVRGRLPKKIRLWSYLRNGFDSFKWQITKQLRFSRLRNCWITSSIGWPERNGLARVSYSIEQGAAYARNPRWDRKSHSCVKESILHLESGTPRTYIKFKSPDKVYWQIALKGVIFTTQTFFWTKKTFA